ncbi:hypothetical protein CBM2587_A70064 [Cupriavidus taiwanensis]|uniref:Uncharacterized protein n=1 Tax=Cupriavidus taiwanensis TaxID=164546 RepID=A0A375BW67_9BURK|nr:hypothetical protein CBM2587_A70064 [Cupriavidus taiwanensis]
MVEILPQRGRNRRGLDTGQSAIRGACQCKVKGVLNVLQERLGFLSVETAERDDLAEELTIGHACTMTRACFEPSKELSGSLRTRCVCVAVGRGHCASFMAKFAGSLIQACTDAKS